MAGNAYVRIRGLGQVRKSNAIGIRGALVGLVTRRAARSKSANGGPTQSLWTTKAAGAARGSYVASGDLGRLLR